MFFIKFGPSLSSQRISSTGQCINISFISSINKYFPLQRKGFTRFTIGEGNALYAVRGYKNIFNLMIQHKRNLFFGLNHPVKNEFRNMRFVIITLFTFSYIIRLFTVFFLIILVNILREFFE